MSKKKKIIIGVVLVVAICIIGTVWSYINIGSRSFDDQSKGFFRIGTGSEIRVNKTGKGSGGSIGVKVKEGEKIVIRSYLEKGSIKINLGKQEKEQTGEESIGELLDMMEGKDIRQIVEGYNTYEFEVPEGEYFGMGIVLTKATGRVTITAESKQQLER